MSQSVVGVGESLDVVSVASTEDNEETGSVVSTVDALVVKVLLTSSVNVGGVA